MEYFVKFAQYIPIENVGIWATLESGVNVVIFAIESQKTIRNSNMYIQSTPLNWDTG